MMNKQISILCYGDSNTWGYVPTTDHSVLKTRYTRAERWTGRLQTLLGDDYYIIEEGLNSRTTNVDYSVPPDRNGKTYLAPCLYSHSPLDLVILGLGGNDTKTYFNRSAHDIAMGLKDLVEMIQSSEYGADMQSAPKILIVTAAIPLPFVEEFTDENGIRFLTGIIDKVKALIPLYAQLATEMNCHFIDVSKNVLPSPVDGVHYDLIAHQKMAELLHDKIKEIFAK